MTDSESHGAETPDTAKPGLEERRLQFEIVQHNDQMRLEREKIAIARDTEKHSDWNSPLVLAMIGGILALLGNAFVALWNEHLEIEKAESDLKVERIRDDANLVIEAIKADSNGTSAEDNLTIIATAKLLNDPEKRENILNALKFGIRPSGNTTAEQSLAPVVCGSAPLSGVTWISCFPSSASLDDLEPTFRVKARGFILALNDAGASITVSKSLVRPERAYLMHWAWMIARGGVSPESVPAMPGVNIIWAHRDANGGVDLAASKLAAQEMVAMYDIRFPPALTSRHTEGRAIDMTIGWVGTLAVKQSDGTVIKISEPPRNGLNPTLIAVAATYGVIKLLSDPPHWSDDGH